MYFLSKLMQATGLTIIVIDFIRKFPKLMSPGVFVIGIGMFLLGWGMQRKG